VGARPYLTTRGELNFKMFTYLLIKMERKGAEQGVLGKPRKAVRCQATNTVVRLEERAKDVLYKYCYCGKKEPQETGLINPSASGRG